MRPLAASQRCGSAVYAQRMLNEALKKSIKKTQPPKELRFFD